MNIQEPGKRNIALLFPDVRAREPDFDEQTASPAAKARNAVRLYPWHFAIALLVCMTLAIALAMLRAPTYTANAELGIGRVDVSTYSIPGWVSASRELAASYSRTLSTSAVTAALARELRTTPAAINSRLSASPIPESPVIQVTAHGSSERDAVRLANGATHGLIRYVKQLNRSNPDSGRLLGEFKRAAVGLREAREARALAAGSAGSADLDELDARIAAAALEVKTLNGLYRASRQGQAATDVIQVLSPAVLARSDSAAFLQRMLFVGLVAGLALGLAVALLRARADGWVALHT
jgi:uncharacterized protein involved in exopolysaccharide biosynthesis